MFRSATNPKGYAASLPHNNNVRRRYAPTATESKNISTPPPLPTQTEMTKADRARMYETYLREEGYNPKIDDDGDVAFKVEGKSYVIMVAENDPEFFRILFPNFWPIESDDERIRVLLASVEACKDTKVAKVFPVRDDTWATVEIFCMPPESFRLVFNRCLSALRTAVNTFAEHARQKE